VARLTKAGKYGVETYYCEAINPENVGHFLAGNKELAGHININAQIYTIRSLE